jgi:hypothetical protein
MSSWRIPFIGEFLLGSIVSMMSGSGIEEAPSGICAPNVVPHQNKKIIQQSIEWSFAY